MLCRTVIALIACIWTPAIAQWNPAAGDYTKSHATDIRVMTYNIADNICSTCPKVNGPGLAGNNGWNALAMTIAALQPDVLLLQEVADNSGGSGSGVDTVANTITTLQLFLYGGTDPFLGGAVTAYVQLYAPDYDLPYIYVSPITDGFNRNVIMSRFPFADLNGDGVATREDIHGVIPGEWALGGNGGIRGVPYAEIDLPDDIYAGNLIVLCAHFKSGGSQNDRDQRLRAGTNVGYWIWNLIYGRGTGMPDPMNRIADIPQVTTLPCPFTPVIFGGDVNEDEATNGRYGPAMYICCGGMVGGDDGVDLDNSDGLILPAADFYNGSVGTFGSSRLDYIIYPDSITTHRRAIVFNSATIPVSARPSFFSQFPLGSATVTARASDHRPVFGDFILTLVGEGDCGDPIGPGPFSLTNPAAGTQTVAPTLVFNWGASTGAMTYTFSIATDDDMTDIVFEQSGLTSTSLLVASSALPGCGEYFWNVSAVSIGETGASNGPRNFFAPLPADLNNAAASSPASPVWGIPDGVLTPTDFTAFVAFFSTGDLRADLNEASSFSPASPLFGTPDGVLTPADFAAFVIYFTNGCV